MEFLLELGLFAAKALVIVVAFVLIVSAIANAAGGEPKQRGKLVVKKLNKQYRRTARALEEAILSPKAFKRRVKGDRKRDKAAAKARDAAAAKADPSSAPQAGRRPRVFVLAFDGNLHASQVENLRREVTAVLGVATRDDEVVLKLTSPGGVVPGYGLAASQLERIKARGIPLTVAVDQVAASGGYLMACVADNILAAPFAVIGSIGVVAGVPNFHRFLKRRDIDFELVTAGKYKRTLTLFGENTDEGRAKLQEELDETHDLFKAFVLKYRPQLDVEAVATGEHWYGQRALALGLVDALTTSDDYLMQKREEADLFAVKYVVKKPLLDRLSGAAEGAMVGAFDRIVQRGSKTPHRG